MSKKEHKIVVTRDKDGEINLWNYAINETMYYDKEWGWLNRQGSALVEICYRHIAKKLLGFLPRKGTKEVITITRGKK